MRSSSTQRLHSSTLAWHAGLVLLVVILASIPCSADEAREDVELSTDTMRVFARADRAIKDLDGYLKAVRFERAAIIGTNYFAVSVGGIDAIRDLEESRGVDPETLAGLYAGFAIPSVAKHLNLIKTSDAQGKLQVTINDAAGRLRYKGAAVRLYSPERLRELFDRRDSFRSDSERRRREAFTDYVFARRRDEGSIDLAGQSSESQEITRRYVELQPLLLELDTALRAEASASSIIAGGNSQHFIGYSVGGIDVLADLADRLAVDPETYAAIYAQRVAVDYADDFVLTPDGRILYQEQEIRMYSPESLESFFKRRDRLAIRAGTR